MLSLPQIIPLVLISVGISIGQVLFKIAAKSLHQPFNTGSILELAFNPYFIAAGFLYAIMTVLWVRALSKLPLSIAYPIGAVVFVIVPVLAYFFLGEPLRWETFAGAGVIIIGVYVSTAQA